MKIVSLLIRTKSKYHINHIILGVSAIASALAVELAVSCLQHPEKGAAPCPAPVGGNKSSNKINSGELKMFISSCIAIYNKMITYLD